MAQIFISYKRDDWKSVLPLVNDIKSKTKLDCWIDLNGIEGGDDFEERIISAINKADILLFMLSKSSITSPWTKKEVKFAIKKGKRVVPISIDDSIVNDCDWLAFNFNDTDCINSNNSLQWEKLIKNILNWSQETQPQISTFSLKIIPNKDCLIFIDGENAGSAKANQITKIPLKNGEYTLYCTSGNQRIDLDDVVIKNADILRKPQFSEENRITFENNPKGKINTKNEKLSDNCDLLLEVTSCVCEKRGYSSKITGRLSKGKIQEGQEIIASKIDTITKNNACIKLNILDIIKQNKKGETTIIVDKPVSEIKNFSYLLTIEQYINKPLIIEYDGKELEEAGKTSKISAYITQGCANLGDVVCLKGTNIKGEIRSIKQSSSYHFLSFWDEKEELENASLIDGLTSIIIEIPASKLPYKGVLVQYCK